MNTRSDRIPIVFKIFAFLCIGVGLYPLLYFFFDESIGLLSTKPESLLHRSDWTIAFYTHISVGGLALLSGWSQFITSKEKSRLGWHRTLGRVYLVSVLVSGSASLYIAPYATGGMVSIIGFSALGLLWLLFTFLAYSAIRKKDIEAHQRWMYFSYACCFAAVTLRLWLPLLTSIFDDFIIAYRMVAWISWVPNLIVAQLLWKRR